MYLECSLSSFCDGVSNVLGGGGGGDAVGVGADCDGGGGVEVIVVVVFAEGRSEELSVKEFMEMEGSDGPGERQRGDATRDCCVGEEELDDPMIMGDEDETGDDDSDLSFALVKVALSVSGDEVVVVVMVLVESLLIINTILI